MYKGGGGQKYPKLCLPMWFVHDPKGDMVIKLLFNETQILLNYLTLKN